MDWTWSAAPMSLWFYDFDPALSSRLTQYHFPFSFPSSVTQGILSLAAPYTAASTGTGSLLQSTFFPLPASAFYLDFLLLFSFYFFCHLSSLSPLLPHACCLTVHLPSYISEAALQNLFFLYFVTSTLLCPPSPNSPTFSSLQHPQEPQHHYLPGAQPQDGHLHLVVQLHARHCHPVPTCLPWSPPGSACPLPLPGT